VRWWSSKPDGCRGDPGRNRTGIRGFAGRTNAGTPYRLAPEILRPGVIKPLKLSYFLWLFQKLCKFMCKKTPLAKLQLIYIITGWSEHCLVCEVNAMAFNGLETCGRPVPLTN
jgi:hypothetical protein